MAKVKLQLVDPASHFAHDGQELSGHEVKEFNNTNEAVRRAIQGRIVRVVREPDVAAALVTPDSPASTPAAAAKAVPRNRASSSPPSGAAND